LMDHHGFLAVGNDIFQAAIRVEHAEAAAKVIYYARQLGGEKPLPQNKVDILHEKYEKVSAVEAGVFSGYCHADECVSGRATDSNAISEAELEQIVRNVVKQTLQELK